MSKHFAKSCKHVTWHIFTIKAHWGEPYDVICHVKLIFCSKLPHNIIIIPTLCNNGGGGGQGEMVIILDSASWHFWCRYPVILSIENHCSIPQQHRMADIMEEIFGDMLFKAKRDEDAIYLPSPQQLKHKILIKVFIHYPSPLHILLLEYS